MTRGVVAIAVAAAMALTSCFHHTSGRIDVSGTSPGPSGGSGAVGEVSVGPTCLLGHPPCEAPEFVAVANLSFSQGGEVKGRTTSSIDTGFHIDLLPGRYQLSAQVLRGPTGNAVHDARCPSRDLTVPDQGYVELGLHCVI
jgi:hypothetical protein